MKPLAALFGFISAVIPIKGISALPQNSTASYECAHCTVDLQRIALITEPVAHAGLFQGLNQVVRDSRGRWFVTGSGSPGQIAVFTRSGEFIGLVGRFGAGAGEFQFIGRIGIGKGDELLVYDITNRRLSRFDSTLQLVAEQDFPAARGVTSLVPLPDGRTAISANIGTRASIGYPIHILQPISKTMAPNAVALSFGSPPKQGYSPGDAGGLMRLIALDQSAQVWSAKRNAYSLETYNLAGEKTNAFALGSPLWQSQRARGAPFIAAIGIAGDDPDLLWVLSNVVSNRDTARGEQEALTEETLSSRYDFIVEAFSITKKQLLAGKRFDGFIAFGPQGLIARPVRQSGARASLEILRPVVIQQPRRPEK